MTGQYAGTSATNQRPLAALLLAAICVIAPSIALAAEESGKEVDYRDAITQFREIVQEELKQGILTGVSVALVDDQRVVLVDGFGMADKQRQIPADATTIYRVGSISKLFTAMSVMQMVEHGKLDLDAPITNYLPGFRIANPFVNAKAVTLRQLMCHRSGLVRESPIGGYFDPHQPTVEASIGSLAGCALVNPPGKKTRYSNIGVTVVGQIVATAAEQEFAPYQQENIFKPLGMKQSAWQMNDRLRQKLAAGYMRVADKQGGFYHTQAPTFELGTIPAGNLYSNAQDMARFASMIMAEGKAGEQQLIRADTLQSMFEPQLIDDESGFGLGFYVGEFADHKSVRHTGAVYGFSCSIVVLPEPGVAAIVLANEDIVSGPVRKISEAGLALLLEAKTGQAIPSPPKAISLDQEQLAKFVGHYESPSYWAEIKVDNGSLTADISGQPMRLTAIGPSKFEADGRFAHRAVLEFKTGEERELLRFEVLGQKFGKVDTANVTPIPATWRKYLGSYGPEFIPLVVSVRHGHLYAMTENMVDYRLTPSNQQVFAMPEGLYADEHVVFQIDTNGKVPAACLANMMLLRNE
jgi:serine beta-lactamase-like protein LACTB